MKKEKMKQICNYFMKGLLLCALVFGFWFMADAGVNADEEIGRASCRERTVVCRSRWSPYH